MPSRIVPFVNGQIYHIYNRGCEKRRIFESRADYQRFLKLLNYYQFEGPKPKLSYFLNLDIKAAKPVLNKKIIEILNYCLMPNHFHLTLKQLEDGGITEFMSKISNGYTKYFNIKEERVGPLLQGEFKSVLVESDEQLIHLSRYIHLNPSSSFLVKDPGDYEWSSYKEYIENSERLCSKEEILAFFKSPEDYKQFVLDQKDYAQKLEIIKHQLLED